MTDTEPLTTDTAAVFCVVTAAVPGYFGGGNGVTQPEINIAVTKATSRFMTPPDICPKPLVTIRQPFNNVPDRGRAQRGVFVRPTSRARRDAFGCRAARNNGA